MASGQFGRPLSRKTPVFPCFFLVNREFWLRLASSRLPPPPFWAQNEPPQDTNSIVKFGAFALTAMFGPLNLLHILLHKCGDFPS